MKPAAQPVARMPSAPPGPTAAAAPVETPEPLDVGAAFEAHGAFVGRVIQRLVGRGPHVDDILQETFIVAYNKRARYDPRTAAVSTWLYGIAVRLCMRHNRGSRRFRTFQGRLSREETGTAAEATPDEALEREQAAAAVHEVLGELAFKQREVFVLYELEELKGGEIAELVGVPEGTVWTRLHQARKKFKKLMRRRMMKQEEGSR